MNAPAPCKGRSILPPMPPAMARKDEDPDQDAYAAMLAKAAKAHRQATAPVRTYAGQTTMSSRIMALMADGRERTADDIITGLGEKRRAAKIKDIIRQMACSGAIVSERLDRDLLYRRADA